MNFCLADQCITQLLAELLLSQDMPLSENAQHYNDPAANTGHGTDSLNPPGDSEQRAGRFQENYPVQLERLSLSSPATTTQDAAIPTNASIRHTQHPDFPNPIGPPPDSGSIHTSTPSCSNNSAGDTVDSSPFLHNGHRDIDREAMRDATNARNSAVRDNEDIDPNDEGQDTVQLSLPADDGMRLLRQRIHSIRETGESNAEKARHIHALMTERYRASLSSQSLSTLQGAERPRTPTSPRSKRYSGQSFLTPGSAYSVSSSTSGSPYFLGPEDLTPTYAPKRRSSLSNTLDEGILGLSDEVDDDGYIEMGCRHYRRNVKLQCYTCKRWYTCRFCHDEVEDHKLERRKTENMFCMICKSPQPASQGCRVCGNQAAFYYCGICKLWDNDVEKSIYHCQFCGICRLGQGLGKDFFHCMTCNVCLPVNVMEKHRCVERSTQCDCPICGEYMFGGRGKVVILKCGHSMHGDCYNEHEKTSYRCPICNKTCSNVEARFRSLDHTIRNQPMPEEFSNTKALINCIDCQTKSVVKYHWLGLKCDECDSYNTLQIKLLSDDPSVGDELTSQGQTRGIPITGASDQRTPSILASRSVPGTDGTSDGPTLLPFGGGNRRSSLTFSYSRNPRPVSPVVENYFGIPPRSESDADVNSGQKKPRSNSFAAWGTSLKATLGLSQDHESEDDGEDEEELDEPALGEDDEEDEDDEVDALDIFGHR